MSQQNKTQLQSSINSQINDNNAGDITASDVRGNLINMTDSLLFNSGSQSFTGSLTITGSDANINALTIGLGGSNIATNTALGFQSLIKNGSNGADNVAVGYQTLSGSISSTRNVAVGSLALKSLAGNPGNGNVAIGYAALQEADTSDGNTVVGYRTLLVSSVGANNTAIGREALLDADTGVQNTAIGYLAGGGIVTGDYNTIIGGNVTGLASNLSNTVILSDGEGNIQYRSSGSATTIGTLLTMVTQSTLPAAASYPFAFAVSSSGIPFFSNGTAWTALY